VHVVVPVRVRAPEHAEDLERCLAALLACDPAPASLLVVDDGSAEPVSVPDGVKLRRTPPSGPAAARNAGAAEAPPGTELLLFVDADIVAPPDTLAQLAAAFAAHADLSAAWGTVTAAHPHPGIVSRYKNLSHRHFTTCLPEETRHLTSMLLAVRPEAFHAVGGFDTTWDTVSVEDVELGRSLFAAGFRVRLLHGLAAEHRHRFTLTSTLRNDLHKVRRHARTTLTRRLSGCPSVRLVESGERRQLRYLLGVPLGVGALGALALGRPLLAAGFTGALLVWERDFWRSLRAAEGTRFALACVPLIVLERGTVALAVTAGVMDVVRALTPR
jgi:GT2 family glycosyltransferase